MKNWPLWEVFIRSKNGLEHRHCGSLHASDATMALENARDVYTRRMEGVSIWVVPSAQITASNPENNVQMFSYAHLNLQGMMHLNGCLNSCQKHDSVFLH